MAMGVDMLKKILVHGWWRMGGAKMSKSLGNVVDPLDMITKYGADAFRFFLLREATMGADGSFSEELLRERYGSDLANGLGNLWHRFASMVDKYYGSKVPEGSLDGTIPVLAKSIELNEAVTKLMSDYNPKDALIQIFEVVTLANQFVEERKPWSLYKLASAPAAQPATSSSDSINAQKQLAETMIVLAEVIARVGFVLQPFLPVTAPKILKRLNVLPSTQGISALARIVKPGDKIEKGEPLFPRLEDELPKA